MAGVIASTLSVHGNPRPYLRQISVLLCQHVHGVLKYALNQFLLLAVVQVDAHHLLGQILTLPLAEAENDYLQGRPGIQELI
jgi:hypothetical protein